MAALLHNTRPVATNCDEAMEEIRHSEDAVAKPSFFGRQRLVILEIKLGQLTNTPENTGPEQKMASYKNLRNKLISEIPSFAAQAGRVESGLTPLEELLVKRKST